MLPVRMERHSGNAEAVVEMLTGHPRVQQVLYPGLAERQGHEAAFRQMKRHGGMVSFRVAGAAAGAVEMR